VREERFLHDDVVRLPLLAQLRQNLAEIFVLDCAVIVHAPLVVWLPIDPERTPPGGDADIQSEEVHYALISTGTENLMIAVGPSSDQ
jgi:hypothetical protein